MLIRGVVPGRIVSWCENKPENGTNVFLIGVVEVFIYHLNQIKTCFVYQKKYLIQNLFEDFWKSEKAETIYLPV